MLKLAIDAAGCTGHGRCYSVSPGLFEPDDFGNGVVIADVVPESVADVARRAFLSCPERAVSVEEA